MGYWVGIKLWLVIICITTIWVFLLLFCCCSFGCIFAFKLMEVSIIRMYFEDISALICGGNLLLTTLEMYSRVLFCGAGK
ncbi:hypothetical protein Hanom_Chr08g00705821 [Helianthus anomalus]